MTEVDRRLTFVRHGFCYCHLALLCWLLLSLNQHSVWDSSYALIAGTLQPFSREGDSGGVSFFLGGRCGVAF